MHSIGAVRSVRLPEKQAKILEAVIKANPDGTFLDLDQIIDSVDYKVKKEAIQFSLRFLRKKGLVKKEPLEVRRKAKRAIYSPTSLGLKVYSLSLEE